jgi:hypothetical protein
MVGFPLSRLLHETVTPVLLGGNATPPSEVLTFLAFQALVSMASRSASSGCTSGSRRTGSCGSRTATLMPTASSVSTPEHAQVMWEARERKRARRLAGRDRATAVSSSGGAAKVKGRRSS